MLFKEDELPYETISPYEQTFLDAGIKEADEGKLVSADWILNFKFDDEEN